MRIAIGSMMHESNTFTAGKTAIDSFTAVSGAELLQVSNWERSSVRGIYDTLQSAGAEVIPGYFARALPSGTVTYEAYLEMAGRIIDSIAKAQPDGICLALHGSMAVEGVDDPEGTLLAGLRARVGSGVPIVCALDMHATMTDAMLRYSDAFSLYRTAPHVDGYETGARAASLLLESLRLGRRLVTACVKIPFLISGEQSETGAEPAKTLFDSLAGLDELAHVRCASYAMGFPWADSPYGGASALACGFVENREALLDTAREMAARFWARRFDFTFSSEALEMPQALAAAANHPSGPVIISDSGDNPTAGAAQDRADLLALMLERGEKNALFAVLADREAYDCCQVAEEGQRLQLALGRREAADGRMEPLAISCTFVRRRAVDGVGYAVVRRGGVTIVLSDARCSVYDPEALQKLGCPAERFQTVALKSGYISPEFKSLAARSILALSPGDTALVLERFPYVRTPRPIFPLDRDMVFI